jgi:Glycosyl transferases group 1
MCLGTANPGRTSSGVRFLWSDQYVQGVLQLLTAIEYLSHFSPDLSVGTRLVMHGANLDSNSPEFAEACRTLLARTSQRVHFAGPYQRRDLRRLIAAVDWLVVPSIWWENSPLAIQEAFAHRRPVICSNIGGMAEKVRWGRVGPQNQRLVVQIRRYYPVNLNHQFTMRAPRLLQIACVSGDQIGQGSRRSRLIQCGSLQLLWSEATLAGQSPKRPTPTRSPPAPKPPTDPGSAKSCPSFPKAGS